ncbi:ABC transporter ATP-binding protein [Arthrobacter sp. CDRTa11]|uniref:ABC transporter ATP-binding protein n=1 Tax=Arthrobacter sp. CDRTa11 TaxID=2651199 RepID=UPI002265E3C7|nr:ATP-binding cassette domain-containing protein [Arthrobacter sp. CDRTa11]UZX02863.1 ABC transporter ATP-binding protein [Arthrobacter sp. CDRTa11]
MIEDRKPIILSVSGLRKKIGDVTAVDNVSFELESGSSLAIVGESGSGKTTVARMIVGLTKPTEGTITLAGSDQSRPAHSLKERITRARQVQLVFQDPYSSLDPRYSTEQTLDEIVRLHTTLRSKTERRRRVAELADLVGLSSTQLNVRPRALSGGQRQRIAIARALAAEPRLLILDEPVAALDVSIQAQVLNLLSDIRRETGMSYLFISHDLAVVRQVSEHVVVMQKGQVVESGRTADVLDHPTNPYTQVLRESVPRPGWRPRRSLAAEIVGSSKGIQRQ